MKGWVKATAALAVLCVLFIYAIVHQHTYKPASKNAIVPNLSKKTAKAQSDQPQAAPDNIAAKSVEYKTITETETIPFATSTATDPNLSKGESTVIIQGANGVKTKTYKVTIIDGSETAREKITETITSLPVNQLIKVGTGPSSRMGPAGATAVCVDGTLSYDDNRSNACKAHGGVNIWYH